MSDGTIMEAVEDVKAGNLKARLQAQADAPIVSPLRAARWAQFDDTFGHLVSSGYELPQLASSIRSETLGEKL